jgi:hypothetical protein
MKSTKELLTIILQNTDKLFRCGLCGLVWRLGDEGIFNSDEHLHILNYIADHRPINLRRIFDCAYYWKPGKIKPRVRWLKRQIKRNN